MGVTYLYSSAICFGLLLLTNLHLAAAVPAPDAVSHLGKRQASNATTNSTVPLINVNAWPNSTLEATAWSLIYTYPLYIWANFAGSVLKNVPVNTIFHQRGLASISSAAVIKPNVDTLYSRVVLDLSQNDVALTIPDISDGRYWNYPVYDLFGDEVANIGIVNNNKPGKYLIRRSDDIAIAPGYQAVNATNSSTGATSQYQGYVNLPTTYGTMLIRILLLANTTADLTKVQTWQNGSHLTNVTRSATASNVLAAPNATSLTLSNNTFLGINTPTKLLTLAARLLPYNGARVYSDRYRVDSILGYAGLLGGKYVPAPGVNLTYAAAIANASISSQLANPANVRQLGNGWQLSIPSFQGEFGTNYAPRAYIAITGYQQQTIDQTLYPGYNGASFNSLSLQSNESLLLTWSGKPPLKAAGFWSLTIYGADQYLIPNSLNRYEVGDRTNLTYNSGSFVYGPQANSSANGPFKVLIQDSGVAPPTNWTNNWLPGPPGGGDFSFILRWYVPTNAITNGSYVYPKVETVAQVRNASASKI